MTYRDAVDDFLAQRRIAVAGVSRHGDVPANAIFRKLRDAGYDVIPVNPHADEVEDQPCYPTVDAAAIATPASAATTIVEDCHQQGVLHVWMHRGIGPGSVHEEAVRRGRELGLTVIPGGCPMMFVRPVDPFHRCLRWSHRVFGKEPTVEAEASPQP